MPTQVLVIDDEPMIRWAMQQTLGAAGYEVMVAATAGEGMALFRARRPTVIFLDLRLPDDDGFTVLRRIKREGGGDSAVIVMTAFTELGTAAEAMHLGAYAYLEKPFAFDGLDALVAKAVVDTHPCAT
jgi:DNA-binding NtrC family response regulator